MHRYFFALPLLIFLFACQNTPPAADEIIPPEEEFSVRYSPSDLQKMYWLAGSWKGGEIRQSFQFHGGNALEILLLEKGGKMETRSFTWHDGRYYYGQWVVTWIGEKDVRLDPVQPGLMPMTWTRLNDRKWHLVRHSPQGDEITVMESANEIHP